MTENSVNVGEILTYFKLNIINSFYFTLERFVLGSFGTSSPCSNVRLTFDVLLNLIRVEERTSPLHFGWRGSGGLWVASRYVLCKIMPERKTNFEVCSGVSRFTVYAVLTMLDFSP